MPCDGSGEHSLTHGDAESLCPTPKTNATLCGNYNFKKTPRPEAFEKREAPRPVLKHGLEPLEGREEENSI